MDEFNNNFNQQNNQNTYFQNQNPTQNPNRNPNQYQNPYQNQNVGYGPFYQYQTSPNDIVYDATGYEYEIKLAKMKNRNRILTLICIIIVAITLLLVAFFVSMNKKPRQNYYDDYGIYFNTDTDTATDISEGTHFAEKFTGYKDTELEQVSSSGKTELDATEVYEHCAKTTVTIYAYTGNQIKNPSGFATGTILTSDGFIITNEHVVDGSTNFTVTTFDGKEYEAVVVGSDAKTDLAVLKIDASDLTPAEFGFVSEMKTGEPVFTIGNPSGLIGSITTGILSAPSRTVSTVDPYTISHIQIDAPINSGNSGGEVLNKYGQVIGIIDMKYITDYAEGIGFAISIDEALPIVHDIIKNGEVTGRVKIGITYTSVSEERAALIGETAGLHVTAINEKMPVAKSGLKVGDIITEINSYDVAHQDEFRMSIREMKIGDTINMTVLRDGKTLEIETTVGAYD